MRLLAGGACVFLLACGGNVVVDDGAGGTSGSTAVATTGPTATGPTTNSASAATGSNSAVTATSVGTGPGGCTSHDACTGDLCLFSTGQCAPPCGGDFCASCGPGLTCDPCATSSCPKCEGCWAACVPTAPGRCDDDDPCPPDQVCDFSSKTCVPRCESDADCGDFAFCEPCLSGSCCGCDDCVSGCAGGE